MSTWKGALAVWRYSAASAASIFGDALGDPNGGRDLAGGQERPARVTRTEVVPVLAPAA